MRTTVRALLALVALLAWPLAVNAQRYDPVTHQELIQDHDYIGRLCSVSSNGAASPGCGNIGARIASGNTTVSVGCDLSVVYDASTNGGTQLVGLVSGKKVYVCGYTLFAGGTANVDLRYGTGTACATSPTKLTPAYQLTAQNGVADNATEWRGMTTAASAELCIFTSAGVAVQAVVYYTQF